MNNKNYIDEDFLLLERPNIREELGIKSDAEMREYLQLYNTYKDLLIQYAMKQYYFGDLDQKISEDYGDTFIPVADDEKDLYQYSANGYLKYYYLRNNVYVERLSEEDKQYLLSLKDTSLTAENAEFIARTHLSIILEDASIEGCYVAYGPNTLDGRFYKPSNAIIVGVRHDEFKELPEDDVVNLLATRRGKLALANDFLEYCVRANLGIPFYAMIYDEYCVNCKKRSGLERPSNDRPEKVRRSISVTVEQFRNGYQGPEPRTIILEEGGSVIFGRTPPSDITIDDSTVSGKHFRLNYDGERIVITDLDSTNGTKVNDERLWGAKSRALRSGDTVQIGRTLLRVHFGEHEESGPTTH